MPTGKKIIIAAAVLVLVASVLMIVRQARGPQLPPMPTHEWFYDLNSQKLFSVPIGKTPPIDAPSGPGRDGTPAGVRAYVYSCGTCSESERFIGYLESYPPQVKQRIEQREAQMRAGQPPEIPSSPADVDLDMDIRTGLASVVRRPDQPEWVSIRSDAGKKLISEALQRCGGKPPTACPPPK